MHFEFERLAEHLLAGDQPAAWEEVMHYHNAGVNSLFIYHELVTKAMQYIGTLWERAQITVADEHLATSTCNMLLSRYDMLLSTSNTADRLPLRAMFFCIGQEQHYLGLKMVSSLFHQNGWETRFFGPDLPLEYALSHAGKWKPDIVGISLTMTEHAPRLRGYLDAFAALPEPPQMLIGGRVITRYDLSAHCPSDTLLFQDLPQVLAWLTSDEAMSRNPHRMRPRKHA